MSYIATIPPDAAHGDVQAMYDRQRAHFGYVPNYAKVFSHRPEVLERWAALLAGIRRRIDARRFELVTLAAAHALRNRYCSLAHAQALGDIAGVEEILAVLQDTPPGALSETDTAIVKYARKVARDARAVTAEDIEALKAHGLEDAEIFDIAATVAARAFFTRLLDGLGVEADAQLEQLAPPLRQALAWSPAAASRSDDRSGDQLPGNPQAGAHSQHHQQRQP